MHCTTLCGKFQENNLFRGAYPIWGALEAVLSAIQVQRPRNGRRAFVYPDGGSRSRAFNPRTSLPMQIIKQAGLTPKGVAKLPAE